MADLCFPIEHALLGFMLQRVEVFDRAGGLFLSNSQTAQTTVVLDIHHAAVLDVIKAFADRRYGLLAERLPAAGQFLGPAQISVLRPKGWPAYSFHQINSNIVSMAAPDLPSGSRSAFIRFGTRLQSRFSLDVGLAILRATESRTTAPIPEGHKNHRPD